MKNQPSFKKFLGVSPWFILFLSLSLPLQASDYETGGKKGDYFVDIASKLGRGFGNVLASPAELTCGQLDNSANRGFGSFFETGAVNMVRFVRRMFFGVVEIGTFFVPTDKILSSACG